MITIYFIRPNKKMFVSNINESAFPKILIDHAMNALLSAIYCGADCCFPPSFPNCTRLCRIKGAGQLLWL